MPEKACRRCGLWLPTERFSQNRNNADGLAPICRACCSRGNQEWRARNREKLAEQKRQHYYENRTRILKQRNIARNGAKYLARLKQEVYNHYGNKCYCCGLDDPRFLTVEHLNNDGHVIKHKGGKRVSGSSMYRYIIDAGFPSDITLACFNCNCAREKWGRGGECPHRQPLPADCDKSEMFIVQASKLIAAGAYNFPSYAPQEVREDWYEQERFEQAEKERRADSFWKQQRA